MAKFFNFNWFRNDPKPAADVTETRNNDGTWGAFGGGRSGEVIVNEQTALTYGAVYCAIRCISETIATLPFPTYRYLAGGGKERDTTHPVYRILDKYPSSELTSVQFREALIAHCLTYGNGFAEIVFSGDGRPQELHLLDPKKVHICRDSSKKVAYKLNGEMSPLVPSSKVIHVAGLGYDGIKGYSPIQMGMKAISLGMKAEAYGESFFGNACRPGGTLSLPGKLTPNAKEALTDSMNHNFSGTSNVGKWMVLVEGASFNPIEISNQEAQFIESRKLGITDIARLFRLPPHILSDMSASTNNNIEQQAMDFVTHSIRPWCVRIEKEFNRKLFSESEQQTWFCQHNIDGLLRADSATRFATYNIALQNGIYNRDEIRELENRNPIPNGQGKVFYGALNMAPLGSQQPTVQPAAARAIEQADKLDQLFQQVKEQRELPAPINPEALAASLDAFKADLGRMLRKESQAARRAARDSDGFITWTNIFYVSHVETIRSAISLSMKAHLLAKSGLFDANMPLQVAERWVKSSQAELLETAKVCGPNDLLEAIDALVGTWEAVRVDDQIKLLL